MRTKIVCRRQKTAAQIHDKINIILLVLLWYYPQILISKVELFLKYACTQWESKILGIPGTELNQSLIFIFHFLKSNQAA